MVQDECHRYAFYFTANNIWIGLLSSAHDRAPRFETRKFVVGSKQKHQNC